MIHIKFKDETIAKEAYKLRILKNVEYRIDMLKTALNHVNGLDIRNSSKGFFSYKVITRKIFTLLNPNIPKKDFNQNSYERKVKLYSETLAIDLKKINISGLLDLITHLVSDSSKLLIELLLCPPERLQSLNEQLLKEHKLQSEFDCEVIKLAFNYEAYTEISNEIKSFFRHKNCVWHCPYCNINKTIFLNTPEGATATLAQLDHFFAKKNSPLLCYSLFNLIPTDDICNGITNKGTIRFSDDFHLNPYTYGVSRDAMFFKPIVGKIGQSLTAIDLQIVLSIADKKKRQLIGKKNDIDETSQRGNINVFKLKTKYNSPIILKKGGNIYRKINEHINSHNSLNNFIERMGNIQLNEGNYQQWYYEEFETEFSSDKFHENPYSKLVRDFHDTVIKENTNSKNDYIKTLIKNNPS